MANENWGLLLKENPTEKIVGSDDNPKISIRNLLILSLFPTLTDKGNPNS